MGDHSKVSVNIGFLGFAGVVWQVFLEIRFQILHIQTRFGSSILHLILHPYKNLPRHPDDGGKYAEFRINCFINCNSGQ